MRATNWDALITSAPINKDAAVARDGKGESWKPLGQISNCYETPPQMKPVPTIMPENLTGVRFGGVVVLGLGVESNSKGAAAWVCRCDCGRYARFSTKGIRANAAAGTAMCGECAYLAKIKAGGGKTPLQRKIVAEKKERRTDVAEGRHAVIHPPLAALVDELVAATGLERSLVLRSMARFIQVEGQKEREQTRTEVDA